MVYQELETERMTLKNISAEDREFILSQFSNDDINRYLFDAEPINSLEEADEIIGFYLQPEPRKHHRWILVNKTGGRKMGFVLTGTRNETFRGKDYLHNVYTLEI